jgi:eukaryotic-like serine/threonine-protein kinase
MTPERYQRISELYHAALEFEAEERAAFLDQSCAGDDALRREIESLIASDQQAADFIAAPALTVAARLLATSETDAMIGQMVGRYKILSLLGAGGMGRVYLAQDSQLERQVALKFLPEYFSHDKEQVQRLRREARSASALNHPNIAHIYEIGEADGQSFIAMEYVEGDTLGEKIHREKTDLKRLLEWLAQVADGLAKAHAAGVVHRDLKPDNVMVTRDGYAKILDFGLAKVVEPPQAARTDSDQSEAATAMLPQLSQPGVMMGTVGYMSPEQAQAKKVDLRSDIFSFGCILYEAATGRRPFQGESAIDSLHKTVYEPAPPVRELNPAAPPELQRIVRRCLMKDPDERYQSIKDVAIELRELRREKESGEPELHRSAATSLPSSASTGGTGPEAATGDLSAPRATSSAEYLINEIRKHKWRLPVLALVVAALAGAGFGLYKFFGRGTDARLGAPLKVTPLTSSPYIERDVAFSPDGKQIAYTWTGEKNDSVDIYVKLIGAGGPLRLTNTPGFETKNPGAEMSPAWSPDGRYIAFLRGKGEGLGIYIIPALGGAERKLADAYKRTSTAITPQALDWSPDGRTIAVVDKTSEDEPWALFLISVETGERRRLTQPPAGYEGDQFVSFSPDGSRLAFVRSHFAAGDIYTVAVAGGEPVRITSDETAVINGLAWTPNGSELIFSSDRGGGDSTLWRVPAAGGPPVAVTGAGENIYDISVARQGDRMAYAQLSIDFNIYRLELTGQPGGRRGAGAPASFISSTREEVIPQFSPDGRRVAFISNRSGSDELWVCDAEGKNLAQLTSFGGPHTLAPGWSPDGRLIAIASLASGNGDIYVVGADGGSPRRLTSDPSAELEPRWSKDGSWIYFSSNRSGRSEVWKMPAAGGAAVQLTRGGGQNPAEAPDGRTVYYLRGEGEFGLWQVSTEGGEETQVFQARVAAWNWAAVTRGIYFFTPQAGHYALEFFDFAARQTTQVATLERPNPMSFIFSLTVSPDERWILYSQRDKVDFDLMLVENFR